MPDYQVVALRFNMDNEEEKTIYNSLERKKATHIKRILKQVLLGKGFDYARRSFIEEIIKEYLSNKKIKFNIENDSSNNERVNIDETELLLAALNNIKGVE